MNNQACITNLEAIADNLSQEGFHNHESDLRHVIRMLQGQQVPATRMGTLLEELQIEMEKAFRKHGSYPSCHHGHSVILEEVEELWAEIKKDLGNLGPAKREAIQVAVTAMRYAHDLCSISNE